MIARILIWSLADSKTSLDELRAQLPELPEGDHWISDEVGERFGLVSFREELPDELLDLGEVRRLIGKDPEIAEEFDVE